MKLIGTRAASRTFATVKDKNPRAIPDRWAVPHMPAADRAIARASRLVAFDIARLCCELCHRGMVGHLRSRCHASRCPCAALGDKRGPKKFLPRALVEF